MNFVQETLSLITMTGHLLQLNIDINNNISILQKKSNLDNSFECEIKHIENMSDTTSI